MIAYLKAFASLRNVAILAGVIFTAYTTHIWLKNKKIDRLELENLEQQVTISKFESAEKTHLEARKKLEETNQQCVLDKEINKSNSKLELTRHQGRIADLQEKYSKAQNYADKQKTEKPYVCGYKVYIDPELLDILHKD